MKKMRFGDFLNTAAWATNAVAILHLIKSYCVPSVLYGCETWYLDRHDYHRLNVSWNTHSVQFLSVVGEKMSLMSCFIATLFQCLIWLTYTSDFILEEGVDL